MKLDLIDRRILAALQRDGRLQNVDLARQVGLSPSPCLRRVRLLEESGVIDRYVAVLNPAKIGKPLTLFARIWLKAQDEDTIEHFIAEVTKLPEVVECYLMLGDCDVLYQLPYPLTALAQVRRVMVARRWGMFISLVQASQQAFTMAS